LYFLNGATINNAGLWQIATDNPIQFSGTPTVWTNSGVLRKISGAGETRIGIVTFVNTASGLVDAQSGTLVLYGSTTNLLGGTFNTVAGATTTFTEGTWFDSGATCTGAGLNQFYGTTLHLRTNTIAGLKLIANNVVLGTNFQQAGAITNLTLDGAALLGTNRVGNSGVLTMNSGSPGSQLTVQAGGELLLASTATKSLINLKLINQGTVNWTAGTIVLGAFGTVVSNGGLWQIQSDDELYDGGSQTSWFTNAGTLRKIAGGADMTRIEGIKFFNMPGAFVQVDAGTLRLPFNYTNTAGTLRLNGGILAAGSGGFFGLGPFTLSGGTLDGSGTLPINNLILGGIVSPGSGAPGLLQFSAGLTFGAGGSGNMLKLDGTGTTPGSGYDQLVVTGSVVISNCLLNISGLPNVPAGTTFTIIQNDGVDPVQGTFIGWPENSLIPVGSQNFRIHYAGGTGNDVTLVKDSDAGPLFSIGSYSNGTFFISGTGGNSVVYTVQATTNFLQWTNLGSATGNVSGKFNFTDTNAYLFRYRFYRTMN
jgi:hypothetical protein